jgi:hypothetical protein
MIQSSNKIQISKSYNPQFVAKIERGKTCIQEGKCKKISLDDIWNK